MSTNFGISKATGDVIAFTGGDDLANPNWIKELRKSFEQGADIVAGRSIMIGLKAWEDLDRVELYHKGFDISYPSANMAFRREVLQKVAGFDPWFITAEDIDLNFRAVDAGYHDHLQSGCHHLSEDQVHRLWVLQAGVLERGGEETADAKARQPVGQVRPAPHVQTEDELLGVHPPDRGPRRGTSVSSSSTTRDRTVRKEETPPK